MATSSYTPADRYRHSILDVCASLHGDAVGTGDPLHPAVRAALVRWLRWRVDEGWAGSLGAGCVAYDDAVRALGRAAVAVATGGSSDGH